VVHADGGVDGEVDGTPDCSDNKLWDKMILWPVAVTVHADLYCNAGEMNHGQRFSG
jgi:hypothetical protein